MYAQNVTKKTIVQPIRELVDTVENRWHRGGVKNRREITTTDHLLRAKVNHQ